MCLNEEMVADLRYFNSLEFEVDSLRSQLETQKTQFFNEIYRLSREYYYADHMNVILGVYTELDEVTNLQCDYLELLEKCEGLETELSKSVPLCQILHCLLILLQLVEIVLFIVDSGCSKHMMGNLKLLINFVEKFLGTVKFGNDQIEHILGYGDLVQGAVTIKRVYYVEGLNHNLFSVGQFCDADLEVAFRKSTCYIRDLNGNNLLTGSRGTDLYSITLQDTNCPNPICLMAKASSSQAWLWHRCLSHLNFDTINLLSKNDIVVGLSKLKFVKDHLCSSCELGKAKRKSFHTKLTPSSKRRLQLLHMDLCGPMHETPEVLINFLRLVQRGLQAQVRIVRTDKGTKFLNQTLHAYFAAEGILHQTSVARTPEQNGVVERRNRTLVEAARTMLSAAKVPLFFWAEAIETAFFTQNCSLVIPRHEKTRYHIINERKPSVKFFHIFGPICYIVRDGENLDKMKEKCDECIFVGYSTQSRAYRVFNKRTRVIMESIHVNFDELPQMTSDHISSDPVPECQRMALEHVSLSPAIQRQANVPQADRTATTSNELDLLFSLTFDELLNGSSKIVSKSSAVCSADVSHQRLQHTTPLNNHTTPASTCQVPTLAPTVTSSENINQAETYAENDQVADDEFINIFCTPEAMADSAWIELMQEELHQFDRLDVGAFMYLTASRPDIMHATCYCARYQAQPTEKHLTAVKRIFRYLKDTIHMGLWYPKDTGFELTAFSDSTHADCLDSHKSTSGGRQFLGGDKLVSWSSKKQDCTSMSFAEAEYVSLSMCCAQVLWMRTQLTDYGFHFDKIPMYCDSKAAIAISCNPLSDLFTKALPEERFKYLVRRLGMRCLTPTELEALANEPA
nr:retrovirus-related Pol polyprotein from transposon TNT 1-94 [Tanacetum cinerariifolium]